MNVFNPYLSRPKPVSLSRTAIVTALVCCVFSVVLTLWFSTQKRQQAKEVALKEARLRAGDMQRELEQAASAAELLAAFRNCWPLALEYLHCRSSPAVWFPM